MNENQKIRLLHLYNNIMNLYGEYANLLALKRFIENNTEAECEIVSADKVSDVLPLDSFDLIYIGAGTEKAQKTAISDITAYREELKNAAENKTTVLFTGNACELLGNSVKNVKGEIFPCLGYFDFETEETTKRITSDAVCENVFLDLYSEENKLFGLLKENLTIGFINKCSIIKWKESPKSMFKLLLGVGDDNKKTEDGVISGNIIASHLIGPLMIKNPHLLKFIAYKIFSNRGQDKIAESLTGVDLPLESKAYLVSVNELKNRISQES